MPFKWNEVGTSFNVLWLYKYMKGGLPPPDEEEVKGKSFSEVTNVCVKRVLAADGGLGIPYSFLMWHWGMVVVFLCLYLGIFFSTTPTDGPEFPWLTFVQKLIVWFYTWESLGLGVIHGPLHAKMAPPFQDWWYRMTPGTLKYNAPFMPCLANTRNYLDVLVEGILTYVFAVYVLTAPEVTPEKMIPLTICGMYELFFDFGQHLHTYGTQNLHCMVFMCFPVEQGQVLGIQLFLTWFYVCSGWCKVGPWFKYLNITNLLNAKYMAGVPWAHSFRKAMFKDYDNPSPDYHLTKAANAFSIFAALCEIGGPLLVLSNNWYIVWLGITMIVCMHIYIISTLIVDVFAWNAADTTWYVILFGILHTGLDWDMFPNMNPLMVGWLVAHVLYAIYGNLVPNAVAYVAAHRHAAGNFSMGVLLVRKSAAAKLAGIKAHAGCPQMGPGWMGEWFGFWALWAYLWCWNLPSRFLMPLVIDAMGTTPPEDFLMLHSVLLFDAWCAHVRFDGLSSLQLVPAVGQLCGFEEGECVLAWVGAFQSWPVPMLTNPKASWKILDSKTGIVKEGLFDVKTLEDPEYKKPSDCVKILNQLQGDGYKPLLPN